MILRVGREMKGTQKRNAMAVCLQNEEKNGDSSYLGEDMASHLYESHNLSSSTVEAKICLGLFVA